MRLAGGALVLLALSVAACGGDDEEPAAAVGRIACSKTMLTVDTPRVQARPDGVHLLAQLSQEHGVSLTIEGQPVRGGVVLQLSPGGHRVKCSDGTGGSLEAGFEVVEEEPAT